MVRFDEARQLMDEMMKVTIFQPSEKRRMLEDERRTFLDPNLIMDARHKIFRENLCKSPAKSSVLAEARKYAPITPIILHTISLFIYKKIITNEKFIIFLVFVAWFIFLSILYLSL